MLYSKEDFVQIVFRVYGYLQTSVKIQPRTLKLGKESHEKTLEKFYTLLPENSGIDFLWDFLVFQFYIYQGQNQERRPNPNWFMGKEAFRRWNEYDEGARYHAKVWASENGINNPFKNQKFNPLEGSVFAEERLRMSRISGPNYCFMKFGEECFDETSEICSSCKFLSDCSILVNVDLSHQLGGTNVRLVK